MENAKDLLNSLPEGEGKQFENFTYSPVNVAMSETTGMLVVGALAIMLFIAYQRLQKKYLALLEQDNRGPESQD